MLYFPSFQFLWLWVLDFVRSDAGCNTSDMKKPGDLPATP